MKNHTHPHDEWIEQLSDYLDGELHTEAHDAVEEHLGQCGACRRVLEELRDVVSRSNALGEIDPPRDLWAGIAATIEAPAPTRVESAKVITLPTASGAAPQRPGWSRISVSIPQLAAASVVLIALSSLGTWAVGSGSSGVAQDPAGVSTGPLSLVSAGEREAAPPELASELAQLEQLLADAWAELDPNTARVLERNLGVIEHAIEDSRDALAQDPGNEFLSEHLERVYERKLTYLRDVAQMTEWAG